jgi:hypothetical protein
MTSRGAIISSGSTVKGCYIRKRPPHPNAKVANKGDADMLIEGLKTFKREEKKMKDEKPNFGIQPETKPRSVSM